ncbi:MAG: hypothetical protein IPP48_03200 [Chitinophagaceae bacterium]|nr:hypothetical protein [Chitinophagaceae bacterium]
MKPKISITLKADIAQALAAMIAGLESADLLSLDDKLLAATLSQFKLKLQTKLLAVQKEYKIKLEHTHAIALAIFYTDYIANYTTSVGNILHKITNQVKQHYQ